MKCPNCGSEDNFVNNSRKTIHNTQVWRRRNCNSCGFIFTTHEIADLSHIIVIKKDGSKERFNRLKLYAGIHDSVVQRWIKGSREELAMNITNEIEKEILKLKTKEVETNLIAEITLRVLKKKDIPAFLRFFSYNKHPHDLRQAKSELSKYLEI